MKKAFTLIEMMIVIAIIAVLVGIALPEYKKYIKKSEATEAISSLKLLLEAELLRKALNIEPETISRLNTPVGTINKVYSILLPLNSLFKKYSIRGCPDTNTIIVSAISDTSSISGTIYYVYGAINNYKTSKYSGNYYLYDYINEVETPNEAPTICRAN